MNAYEQTGKLQPKINIYRKVFYPAEYQPKRGRKYRLDYVCSTQRHKTCKSAAQSVADERGIPVAELVARFWEPRL